MSCTIELTPLQVEALVDGLYDWTRIPRDEIRRRIVKAGTIKPSTPTTGATFPPSWVDDVQFQWAGDTGACIMLFPDCAEAPLVAGSGIEGVVRGSGAAKTYSVCGPNMAVISKPAALDQASTEAVIKDALRGAFLQLRAVAHA